MTLEATPVEMPAPVRTLVDAINDGDLVAFVDAFTGIGAIDDWGRVCVGPAGLRAWGAAEVVGPGAKITVLGASTTGAVTDITFSWASTVFTGSSRAVITCVNGKVAKFVIPRH